MNPRSRAALAALVTTATAGVAALPATPAAAGTPARAHVRVIGSGLDGPFGLQGIGPGGFVVAENDTGHVTQVTWRGHKRTILSGAAGVAGVAAGFRRVFALTGGGDETAPPPVGSYPASSVVRSDWRGRHARVISDLGQYELDHNPDHQAQFDSHHVPYDTLSNPFSMNLSRYGLLVADGGANDVLRVNPRTGHISTFFVPPTVKDVPACLAPGAQLNPGTVGCDPVPTGIAVTRHGVYVSTLGAEVPGAGRVYRLNPRTGRVLRVWKGLTAPTGIAVSPRGTIYVSQVLAGAPQGPPPPGFDPAGVGLITRISRWGHRSQAQVTMPTGLVYQRGHLFASAWSVASFLGLSHVGQIVKVDKRSFR